MVYIACQHIIVVNHLPIYILRLVPCQLACFDLFMRTISPNLTQLLRSRANCMLSQLVKKQPSSNRRLWCMMKYSHVHHHHQWQRSLSHQGPSLVAAYGVMTVMKFQSKSQAHSQHKLARGLFKLGQLN